MSGITIGDNYYETDLVVFDKDGTLLDFHETWVGIIRELIRIFANYTPVTQALKQRIEKTLGVSVDKNEIDGNGALAMGTFAECNALLTYSLYREGIRWDAAQEIVHEAGARAFGPQTRKKHVKPVRGALALLETLKSRGISIAVATNDKFSDALIDMEHIGASPYLDIVVGADSVEHSKPSPDMIMKICSSLGKEPGRSVLIGDTAMDAMLGKNAGVMLTVGLRGIVPESELARYMDVVVSGLEEIR